MGQNAEVMPRPLNSSIVNYSLEVRTILSFNFKETHAWFCADYCHDDKILDFDVTMKYHFNVHILTSMN